MAQDIQTTSGNMQERQIHAIDLFCGVGGLTNGLQKSGIKVDLGIDIDPYCEFPYSANNATEFLLKSVEDLDAEELRIHYPKNSITLLAGCAPCQTFSTYNQKAKKSDKRWWLLKEFSRLVEELSPDLVTMENVPRLVEQNVFDKFLKTLIGLGYSVSHCIVDCADYGVPQQRKRLVLLASKFGEIEMISPEKFGERRRTVREAIGKLPPLLPGESYRWDPLHRCSVLSETNLQRIRASHPGGTWRDWPKALRANCHKKKSGKTYPSVYGRMEWDKPAPTVTTQFFGFGNGRFGHPEQDRALSLREGAIIQSFPDDYIFTEPQSPIYQKIIGRLIGNAVPVKLGQAIGTTLIDHIPCFN